MQAHDMRGVLVRLSTVEHALLTTILKEEVLTLQAFFRQAAKQKIRQRAQAFAAPEGHAGEDPEP